MGKYFQRRDDATRSQPSASSAASDADCAGSGGQVRAYEQSHAVVGVSGRGGSKSTALDLHTKLRCVEVAAAGLRRAARACPCAHRACWWWPNRVLRRVHVRLFASIGAYPCAHDCRFSKAGPRPDGARTLMQTSLHVARLCLPFATHACTLLRTLPQQGQSMAQQIKEGRRRRRRRVCATRGVCPRATVCTRVTKKVWTRRAVVVRRCCAPGREQPRARAPMLAALAVCRQCADSVLTVCSPRRLVRTVRALHRQLVQQRLALDPCTVCGMLLDPYVHDQCTPHPHAARHTPRLACTAAVLLNDNPVRLIRAAVRMHVRLDAVLLHHACVTFQGLQVVALCVLQRADCIMLRPSRRRRRRGRRHHRRPAHGPRQCRGWGRARRGLPVAREKHGAVGLGPAHGAAQAVQGRRVSERCGGA